MKALWTRLICVLLCTVVVGLLPMSAGAEVYHQDGASYYEETAEGIFVETAAVTDQAANNVAVQSDETLPKLATPTDLEWGKKHTESVPGWISWKPAEPSQGKKLLTFYGTTENGEEVRNATINYGVQGGLPEQRSASIFCHEDMESGTYYFTLQSKGDGVFYADSDVATSDTWTYVKPDTKLDSCTNPAWSWPEVRFDPPGDTTNVGGYEVEFYFAATADDTPELEGATVSYYISEGSYQSIYDSVIQRCGTGYYYFKVRALSGDITKDCNSDWSEMSPAYNLTELAGSVEENLEDVLDQSGSMSDDEIRDAVQSLDTEELRSAMLADDNVAADVAALEEKVGGAAVVEVADEASTFDQSKVSVVGANLNNAKSAEDPIKLVIDKPEKDHVLDATYNNSVAVKFSMGLENVEDTQNLAVPVKITLPVPSNINPDFLVVLHYHADGSVEELMCGVDVHVFKEDGQTYASFVLSSFSDFVLTHTVSSVPMYRMYDPNSGEHFYTGAELERDFLVEAGWHYEGVGFNFPEEGEPVYRLYEPVYGEHLYTMDEAEVNKLVGWGWNVEGVAFNSAGTDEVPQYRLHNPNAKRGGYHFTGSEAEKDFLVSIGWIDEGIGWYSCAE